MKSLAAWQTHFYCCGDAACLVAIAVCHGAPWRSKCQFRHSARQSWRQILCLEYHSSTLQSLGSASIYTSEGLTKKQRHCRPVKHSFSDLTLKLLFITWSVNVCFICLLCFARRSYFSFIFFSCLLIQCCRKNMKLRLSLFTQTSAVAQFISYLLTSESTWVVRCRGCCSDIALVLAVKWSICRYVCLHHRRPLTHSLLHSPDEQKHLIYSGFKDAAFSPIWLCFPGGSVFPFESQPNRLWWHLCVLHESTAFHWEKYAYSVVPGMK